MTVQPWNPDPSKVLRPTRIAFGLLLRELRDQRRLSQTRLSELAGFDHSYVSRIEAGGRKPTREAVLKIAKAMQLRETDRDALLAAAGYMPADPANLFVHEPVIGAVADVLASPAVPAEVRDDVRRMLLLLVRQAWRQAVHE